MGTNVRVMVVVLVLAASSAFAEPKVRYGFSYTPTAGPIQAFAFDLTFDDFISPGPFSFEPFSATDNLSVWTFDHAVACNVVQVGAGVPAFEVGFILFLSRD